MTYDCLLKREAWLGGGMGRGGGGHTMGGGGGGACDAATRHHILVQRVEDTYVMREFRILRHHFRRFLFGVYVRVPFVKLSYRSS